MLRDDADDDSDDDRMMISPRDERPNRDISSSNSDSDYGRGNSVGPGKSSTCSDSSDCDDEEIDKEKVSSDILLSYRPSKARNTVAYLNEGDGASHNMLLTDLVQFFYLTKSFCEKPQSFTTSLGQTLLFYNTLYTSRRGAQGVINAFHYCVFEGRSNHSNSLIYLGSISNKNKPFKYRCYIFDVKSYVVLTPDAHKVLQTL